MTWIRDIFKAGAVNKGGIVRRSKKDVMNHGGYVALRHEVKNAAFI